MGTSFWRGVWFGFWLEWLNRHSLMRKTKIQKRGMIMATKSLFDAHGRLIGTLEDNGGKKKLYDGHGRYLGEYNGRVTLDAHGRMIGQGDLLTMLLNK